MASRRKITVPQPVTSRRSPEHQAAVVALRGSSAAGSHDPRPRRLRTRGAQQREALRDW